LIEEGEEEMELAGAIELSCESSEDEMYEYEESNVDCVVRNVGNVYLEGVKVCLDMQCNKIDLGITRSEDVGFVFKPAEAGKQEVVVKANHADASKSAFIGITVFDNPVIEIGEVEHPNEVRYKDMYEIAFVLNKKSKFPPENLVIVVEPVHKEFEINELKENRRFVLKMYGSELNVGKNDFKIIVSYEDKNGKEYEASKEFSISLVDVNVFQRVVIFFRSVVNKIISVFR